jgi:hypothetical protein
VLRRLPTDQALLLAGATAAQRHEDGLLDPGRVIRFRQQPLGIDMQRGFTSTPASTSGHG